MIRTFLYILSISLASLLTHAMQVQGQSAPPPEDTSITKPVHDSIPLHTGKHTDKIPAPPKKLDTVYTVGGGVRIGLDISRLPLHFFQPYRTDITVQADARISKRWYAAIEAGYNRTSHSDTNYTYKGNGMYATIGADYDFLKKKDPKEKNMVFGGIRYGFAHNTYEVPTYNIHSSYWDSNQSGSYPQTTISAHWVELVLGMRVEVLPNFFLGWGLRQKIMISNSASDAFPAIVIPGYGSGTKKSQFDMNYSVAYYFPLYKITVRESREPKKKKD